MSNDPEALYEVCRVRVFQEKYQSAAGACAQAHNLDMQNASVGRIYGLALLGSNQPAKAVQMLSWPCMTSRIPASGILACARAT